MAEHNELGKEGEKAAVAYLQKEGYTILRTNYVYQKAEIDIIAQHGNILAIVEVKTRSTLEYGLPQDFVKPKKIKLLVMAINRFIEDEDLDVDARFDIVAVHKNGSEFDIEHLKDAFFIF
jgi:putative endonuclease